MTTSLSAVIETFPVRGHFTIARGSRTEARTVRATISRGNFSGSGECVPYARYNETPEDTLAQILQLAPAIADGLTRQQLQEALAPGAARNALDCAFWSLEARESGVGIEAATGLEWPDAIETAFTISLDEPARMAEQAARHADMPLLKLKLGAAGDAERLASIRRATPDTRLVVDANEGWAEADLPMLLATCRDMNVELVEQPLPAAQDQILAQIEHLVPICADESVHALYGLEALVGRYDAINVKLDKTGGLTEALAVVQRAEELGLSIMVGCMLSTSLSMLPASVLSSRARWVDLDGPLLLTQDRPDGLVYANGVIERGQSSLWA